MYYKILKVLINFIFKEIVRLGNKYDFNEVKVPEKNSLWYVRYPDELNLRVAQILTVTHRVIEVCDADIGSDSQYYKISDIEFVEEYDDDYTSK